MTGPESSANVTPAVNADTTAGADVLEQNFTMDSLVSLRHAIVAHASNLGVDE